MTKRKTLLAILLGLGASAFGGRVAVAQASGASNDSTFVRGTVTGKENGLLLQYAFVSIPSLGIELFANEQGRFTFPKLRPGSYRLRVRQLGYSPLEVDIVVASSGVQELSLELSRLATKLKPMQVTAEWVCAKPGRPAIGDGTNILEVFEQLEQNAARLKLLAQEYPFVLTIERQLRMRRESGVDSVESTDTKYMPSSDRIPYRVGSVVRMNRMSRQGTMRIPTLIDFADKEFQKNHCFRLRGIEEVDGAPYVRVDFKAAARIRDPDVDGTVYLETGNFRLSRAVITLTRIPRELDGLLGVEATTSFTDLAPGLPVIASIHAENRLQSSRKSLFVAAIEDQVTTKVNYVKQRPDSALMGSRRPPG
ncbi:MAG: carboxypeptidase regulatory-like domain-containing protein [Gemmatimonadaceae bacterium]